MIQNNEKIIRQTLESVKQLKAEIIISDAGCHDKTVKICEEYGHKPIRVSIHPDRSKARNEIISISKTEWQMFIEPGEVIASGIECLQNIGDKKAYRVEIMQDDIITKQIRLFKKDMKFVNPVFEKIDCTNPGHLPIILWRNYPEENKEKLLEAWRKKDPLAVEPYYYQACTCLKKKNYKDFMTLADYYLFNRGDKVSSTMLRYYLGIVNCLITNDLDAATRNAIICLKENVLMAEFWCLLGDIFCKAREFNKAKAFYENALALGGFRLRNDEYPVHIIKYDSYPKNMIKFCEESEGSVQEIKILNQVR